MSATIARPAAGKFAVVLISPHGRPLCIRHEGLTLAQALFHAIGGPNVPLIVRQADLDGFPWLPSWFEHLIGFACAKGGEAI